MPQNNNVSDLDAAQIIQREFDVADDAMRVNVITGNITASNPSVGVNGAIGPGDSTLIGGLDGGGNLQALHVDGTGNLDVIVENSLITAEYDELVISYVGATTDIDTVIYKSISVTVATLTMSYDGSNRLIGVVRT